MLDQRIVDRYDPKEVMMGRWKLVSPTKNDAYRKSLKIMVCDGLARNAGPGVHCEMPMGIFGLCCRGGCSGVPKRGQEPAIRCSS